MLNSGRDARGDPRCGYYARNATSSVRAERGSFAAPLGAFLRLPMLVQVLAVTFFRKRETSGSPRYPLVSLLCSGFVIAL